MSQQYMEFDQDKNADELAASYKAGYQQGQRAYFDAYTMNSRGQKILSPESNSRKGPTSGQRLALAIVSFSLFALITILVGAVMVYYLPYTEYFETTALVMSVFGVAFAALLIVVNIFFNRKH